jgi:signal transduction histidine kinase
VLYPNTDSIARYNSVIGQLGDRLVALADLTKDVANQRATMRILASYVVRHLRQAVPALTAGRKDRSEAVKLITQTINGDNSIGRIAAVADELRDDALIRRSGLLAQTIRVDHYSTIALITVLICTSLSFGALTYSVRKWLQDRDQTVRLLHEAKLAAERANSAKTNFLALMSHELRTPLNAILGFAEVIRDRILGPGRDSVYSNYAADIHSSGSHLLQLINKLLDVVQNGEGKTTLRLEVVDVAQIAHDCLKMVRAQSEKGGVILKSHIPAKLPTLRADGLRLTEIILNLLSNAVKFTQAGGVVALTLDPRRDVLVIRVEDNGTGIAAARMPTLFEPFGDVADPLSGQQRGSGLGLSIAKHLTELHGGTLTIASQAGRGTVAVIILPLSASAEGVEKSDDRDEVLHTVARV